MASLGPGLINDESRPGPRSRVRCGDRGLRCRCDGASDPRAFGGAPPARGRAPALCACAVWLNSAWSVC